MNRLILVRHGKAENESASGGDFDRRLTPRGVRQSAQMAERLAELGLAPSLALVSPAARARETWAAMQAWFPATQASFEPRLYNAEAGGVRQIAEQSGPIAGAVMVVAHNPGLQDLTVDLLREGKAPADLIAQAQRQFPPAAASVFLVDDQGRPAFDGLMIPRSD